MSENETGTITDVQIIPYDIRTVPNIHAESPYSPYNYDKIVENCEQIKETIILHIERNPQEFKIVERVTDIGITSSWFCAIDCLAVGLYDPSILFASISVECILNHDLRLEKERQNMSYKWLDLNWQNLKIANDNGLPTDMLLNQGEFFSKESTIEFIIRRNKVAHGDLEGYYQIYPGSFDKEHFDSEFFDVGYSRPSKQHALDQIEKAKNFIVSWAQQKPKIRLH